MARQGEHPKKKHEAVDTIALAFKETGFQQVGLVEIPEIFFKRFQTGIEAFDNLLGGEGFLPGSSFTVTGRAGAGKTTFLLQMLEALAKNGKSTGYASGEESIYQIAYTSKRLELTHVQIANMTDVDRLADMMKDFDILIIDSWQFIQCKHIEKRKALETYAAKKLVESAQKNSCVLGVIQHLTVMGTAKGGTFLPHTVDMNMEIETTDTGDDEEASGIDNLKTIRVTKNRFGRTGEINLIMTDKGFDFTQIIKVEVSSKTKKNKKRGDKEKQNLIDLIKKMKGVTLDQVNQHLGASWKNQHYLRLLTNDEVLKKSGRGNDAIWSAGPRFDTYTNDLAATSNEEDDEDGEDDDEE